MADEVRRPSVPTSAAWTLAGLVAGGLLYFAAAALNGIDAPEPWGTPILRALRVAGTEETLKLFLFVVFAAAAAGLVPHPQRGVGGLGDADWSDAGSRAWRHRSWAPRVGAGGAVADPALASTAAPAPSVHGAGARRRAGIPWPPRTLGAYAAALAVAAFSFAENLRYFIVYPDSSIYWRLPYSQGAHLVTALIYALVALAPRPPQGSGASRGAGALRYGAALVGCTVGHWLLNWGASAAEGGYRNALVITVSAINVGILVVLGRKAVLAAAGGYIDARTGP